MMRWLAFKTYPLRAWCAKRLCPELQRQHATALELTAEHFRKTADALGAISRNHQAASQAANRQTEMLYAQTYHMLSEHQRNAWKAWIGLPEHIHFAENDPDDR